MRRSLGIITAVAVAVVGIVFGQAGTASAGPGTPVIFVHGFTGSASNWTTAMSVFRAGGYSSGDLYAYEYNSYGDNRTNAQGLAAFANRVRSQTGAAKVDLVNHSMGGLVSLWYLHELNGTANVRKLASIAGANHGTTSAGACTVYLTCRQMLPGSDFIDQVTSGDETPGPTAYGTWYSACDGVINPYTSTRLSGAQNNNVVCQSHLGFLNDTTVLTSVRTFLN
jgi:triacylglycerol lipase